jgi:outer membrane lipoprotein-sorting protein
MQWYVGLLDRADRILDPQVFDGRECVGFEVSSATYGDNPEGRFDRIWFDVETRLPARIERHGISLDFDAGRTLVLIHDQFEYYAQVPADLFVPTIPDGFINAHPDEVRAQRDAAVKGEMIFAEVPEGLKEIVISALKAVESGSYREGTERVWFSKDAWRRDCYSDGGLVESHWYVPSGQLPEGPFEPQGGATVTETIVNFEKGTFQAGKHRGSWTPSHPMRRIIFVAGLIDRADHFYEDAEIDGVSCFGFDVSAKKYGDNPDGMVHSVWLDAATSLPVRMEFAWPARDGAEARVDVKDQFEWNPELPDDLFTPQIPPDFTPAGG